MPTIRHDKTFGKRVFRWMALLALACFIVVPIAIEYLRSRISSHMAFMILGVFIAPVLIVAFVTNHFVLRSYRCPECGASLALPKRERGKPFEVRYFCQHCDIIWATGVREIED